ncbi:MAG: thermonuclease family protein [Proteobacteria bacterium]|nr:hypothetical protein [Desulfobacteraceae bacterium]MBU3980678.1 thermonuclease family protein [Pseudomonadota bacterium]MBU4012637.1 thermonuclease family protein [Pseudomonadota bacterium]MBU4068886.1 thermonuclease family protein [Pseudomonadota bacterium]MBU4100230.1 thermonuclease family protein [Pseudomonadota bacterium]
MKKSIILFKAFCLVILLSCVAGQSFAQNWYGVRWVDDGDTIVLIDGRRVRYIGINAPEIDHKDKKAEPCGYSAKNYNKNMVLSKKVRLEFDREKHDQYGRLLAYVFLEDGTFVNEVMIKNGYAYSLYRNPNKKYNKRLFKAQRDAMTAKKGIWNNWKEEKNRYIGNKGSKRFHLETCTFGEKTGKTNTIYFNKKWDAFWAGFAPCKLCIEED